MQALAFRALFNGAPGLSVNVACPALGGLSLRSPLRGSGNGDIFD